MLIEAVKEPVRCRWAGGEIRLEPGQPVDLPEERALQLLEKIPDKVKLVSSLPRPVSPGDVVTWESPLFGTLTGEVLEVTVEGRIEIFHPLTQRVCTIPLAWVRRGAREAHQ